MPKQILVSFLIPLLLFVIPQTSVEENSTTQWILWNVGQGQWITHIDGDFCWHFDFGGEKNPIKFVYPYCSWRENRLVLSHGDLDHFSFLKSMRQTFRRVCQTGPSWNHLPPKVPSQDLPHCAPVAGSSPQFFLPPQNQAAPRNQQSQFTYFKHWLFTGDAPTKIEKLWLAQSRWNKHLIHHLVLGHHGSKTSNSMALFQALPGLQQCSASSRSRRYGHPHREVRLRSQKFCALLLSEDWNHIHFFHGK